MKNLAGESNADEVILEELYLAGIPAMKVDKIAGEVPYTYVGKFGDWTFKRRWYYWSATVEDAIKGLPLEVALKLHNKKYPFGEKILGQTIRSGGHCGCTSPDEYGAQPIYNAELAAECKALGIETSSPKSEGLGQDETEYPKLNYGEMSKLCNEGKIKAKRYVDCYHIDDQIGLNEFAKVLFDLKTNK